MKKICVNCGQENGSFVALCQKCGANMEKADVASGVISDDNVSSIFSVGVFVIIIGLFLTAWSFFIDTSVGYSDIVNLGLLQGQMMILHCGLAVTICGSFFVACGSVVNTIKKNK